MLVTVYMLSKHTKLSYGVHSTWTDYMCIGNEELVCMHSEVDVVPLLLYSIDDPCTLIDLYGLSYIIINYDNL